MNKAEIRKAAMRRRNALSADQLQQLSEKLLTQFSRLDLTAVSVIHLFLPIEKKKEPNTYLIIDWLQLHHPEIKILVPRADFNTALMTHHVYTDSQVLEKNIFDIMEPQNENAHQGNIDLVLIPLLAFDQQGYRVGYGKGFYDRFLQGINTRKFGLSLFPPVAEISDTDAYDVKMDLCLTPDKVYVFD